MSHRNNPLLLTLMLLAVGLRTVFGAPCCLPPTDAAAMHAPIEYAHHAHQSHHLHESIAVEPSDEGHAGHGDDPSANPCCSACGPTLPSEPTRFAAQILAAAAPEPARVRALAIRPPYPAYEATGPPLLI